ncbi:MAG: hypothetical protein LBR43_01605 [Spiroplasmataceae bacterium]|jgi:MFS superfamily sulfate permease-like transporter|nr:hypothetical protein [Spiroplasmataceae bacterium]
MDKNLEIRKESIELNQLWKSFQQIYEEKLDNLTEEIIVELKEKFFNDGNIQSIILKWGELNGIINTKAEPIEKINEKIEKEESQEERKQLRLARKEILLEIKSMAKEPDALKEQGAEILETWLKQSNININDLSAQNEQYHLHSDNDCFCTSQPICSLCNKNHFEEIARERGSEGRSRSRDYSEQWVEVDLSRLEKQI